jgi:DNA-directed RNA polymerase subunit RPC12/RpoP
MKEDIWLKPAARSTRCAFCGKEFRTARYRFVRSAFCSKRCLDKHLAKRVDSPTSLKEWIEEARRDRRG